MRRRITLTTVLAWITSFVAYVIFAWIDWRLVVAMAVFDLSNVLREIKDGQRELMR